MDTRIAVISMIVENSNAVAQLNDILHNWGDYIVGRMGIPYKPKEINVISIVLDAPLDTISALAGKLGNLPGISIKTAISNV